MRLAQTLSVGLIPALWVTDQAPVIRADLERWSACMGGASRLEIMALPEFRSLLQYRMQRGNLAGKLAAVVFFALYRREYTLLIQSPRIGPGLFIQHGFATVIAAESVGANCWVNQQVTIGFSAEDGVAVSPVLEDGAKVHAGAQVIGRVRIGRDAVVGAGAVVVKDVPDGMVATGVPATNRPPGRRAASFSD